MIKKNIIELVEQKERIEEELKNPWINSRTYSKLDLKLKKIELKLRKSNK